MSRGSEFELLWMSEDVVPVEILTVCHPEIQRTERSCQFRWFEEFTSRVVGRCLPGVCRDVVGDHDGALPAVIQVPVMEGLRDPGGMRTAAC